MYDSRVSQFLSIDPKWMNFPSQSPYLAFNANLLFYNDPTGITGEVTIVEETDQQGNTISTEAHVSMKVYLYSDVASKALMEQVKANMENAVQTKITNLNMSSPVIEDGARTPQTVNIKLNIQIEILTLEDVNGMMNEDPEYSDNTANFIYVTDNMNDSGEYGRGNVGYVSPPTSQENLAHLMLHLLAYKPSQSSNTGSHSKDPNSLMYERGPAPTTTMTPMDWSGVNNCRPLNFYKSRSKANTVDVRVGDPKIKVIFDQNFTPLIY